MRTGPSQVSRLRRIEHLLNLVWGARALAPRPEWKRECPVDKSDAVRGEVLLWFGLACVLILLGRQTLKVIVGQKPAIVIAFQPVVEMDLVEIRGDQFFSQLMRFTADERYLQPSQHSNQRLHNAVWIPPYA